MPENVRVSPAGTPGCPQGRQAALGLLLPDPDEAEPPDEDPLELLDDEDDEPESEDEDELPADDAVDVPESLLAAAAVPFEEERLSVR